MSLLTLPKKQASNPWGGIDNLLIERAIINLVGYTMIVGYIHAFTERLDEDGVLVEEQITFRIVNSELLRQGGYYEATLRLKLRSFDVAGRFFCKYSIEC